MEIVFLKIILCSSLFIAVYYLFLEKEKMYRFNRFFLISSLVFSYIAPFISIPTKSPKPTTITPQLIFEETTQEVLIFPAKQESFDWMNVIWVVYGFITIILLIRTIISIVNIKKLKGKELNSLNYNIVLTKENLSPFSFWNTIYIGENYLINNKIDERILLHEKSHLDQKHSLDLILIEILRIFSWFNPSIYLYKKAIVTNHELLADEAVLKNNFNIKDYQNLILQEIISTQKYNLTHSFNFNTTKKRFIMMTTKKSKFILLKKIISIPLFMIAFSIFVQKTYANDISFQTSENNNKTIQKNETSALSDDPYEEFKTILNKYADLLENKKYADFTSKVSQEDRKKLETLYFQLTDKQRNEQKIIFYKAGEPKKRIPTEAELKSFLDKSKYAVWIDEKKIENNTLKNYKTSDFANIFISSVYKNARTAKNPQPFQVTLTTPSAYEKFLRERTEIEMGFKVELNTLKSKNDTVKNQTINVTLQKNTNDGNFSDTKAVFDVATPPSQTTDNITAPEYPGGTNQLRSKVSTFFNAAKINLVSKEIYRCQIHYVIDEKGNVKDIKTEGNNDAFSNEAKAAFMKATDGIVWKPATKDGIAVRYSMKMPLTMQFE